MNRLQNKVAIVTGAAGGMGEAISRLFVQEGAQVLATDIQFDKMNAWVQDFRRQHPGIECMLHDVSSESDWQKVVAKALELYGKIHDWLCPYFKIGRINLNELDVFDGCTAPPKGAFFWHNSMLSL